MNSKLVNVLYKIELQAREKLQLPEELVDRIGAGQWLITITPLSKTSEPIA